MTTDNVMEEVPICIGHGSLKGEPWKKTGRGVNLCIRREHDQSTTTSFCIGKKQSDIFIICIGSRWTVFVFLQMDWYILRRRVLKLYKNVFSHKECFFQKTNTLGKRSCTSENLECYSKLILTLLTGSILHNIEIY